MQENSSVHRIDARDQLSPLHRTDVRDQLSSQDRCKRQALFTGQMQETSSILSPKDRCKRAALSSFQEIDARDQLSTQGRCKRPPALSSPQDRCKRPAHSTVQMQETSSLHRTDARDQLSPQYRCKRPALSTGQMQETSFLHRKDARDQLSPLHRTDARDKLSPQDRCKRQVLSSQTDRSALSIMLDKDVRPFHRIDTDLMCTMDQIQEIISVRMDRHKVNSVHRIRYKRSALSEWVDTSSILCIGSDTRDQLWPHCSENPNYAFPEMKLRGLVPNSYSTFMFL
jgi:hypothetical protein